MNCDEVFHHLTRLPSGEPASPGVARHLERCLECRSMAELFRPAVDLLDQDDVAEREAEPDERWERVWEAARLAERAAAQLEHKPGGGRTGRARRGALARSAGLLAAGLLVGSALTGAAVLRDPPLPHAAPPARGVAAAIAPHAFPGECDRLLAVMRRAEAAGVCPTCSRPRAPSRSPVISLCVACHVPPPSADPDTSRSL